MGSLPSVSYTTKPCWPSLRFGGKPRLKSVPSTLLYHVRIFIIRWASSAVADLAAQFACHPDLLFDPFDCRHPLTLARTPQIVLDTAARMLPERDTDVLDRPIQAHYRLIGKARAVRGAANQLHQIERIGAGHPSADHTEETVHRPHVEAAADEALAISN